MTTCQDDYLQRVHAAGIVLMVQDDRLFCRCSRGAMTPELRAELEARKPDLLYEYHERAAIHEYDGHLPREEAEARAARMFAIRDRPPPGPGSQGESGRGTEEL